MVPLHRFPTSVTLLLALWLSPLIGAAPRNISYDDAAPEISYTGLWDRNPEGTGGYHHVTSSSDAYATFRFSGTAVYFMSPLWPYPVGTDLSLSPSRAGFISLDLQDYSASTGSETSTRDSAVVASFSDLPRDTIHELRISVGSTRPYAIVDEIIVTIDDQDLSSVVVVTVSSNVTSYTTVRMTASASVEPTSSESSQGTHPTGLPVAAIAAIGAVGGAAALVTIIFLLCYIRKRSNRRQNPETRQTVDPVHPPPLPPPSAHPAAQREALSTQQQYTATGVFNPYRAVSQQHPPATGKASHYRSFSDMSSSSSTPMMPRHQDPGYVPSLSESRHVADSEGRGTWVSAASGSSGAAPSTSSRAPLRAANLHSHAGMVDEAEQLPPDYEQVFGGSHRRNEKGLVLQAPEAR